MRTANRNLKASHDAMLEKVEKLTHGVLKPLLLVLVRRGVCHAAYATIKDKRQ